ncbi:MAG: adenylate/guanylate cyclase domain-containing protein [Labilithrix sp.]|nr:adenylate/guanylate cyclase domain-containing protein [Labilithrix sp.]MCW5813702.1 adenylate/guanylate cyclase domain-containing protein [Labilithrix sp.]
MSSAELTEAQLRELFDLRDLVDELIEEGLVKRWSVSEMLGALLPRIGEQLAATAAWVETYGEDLNLRAFLWGQDAGKPPSIPDKADVWARTSEEKRERVAIATGEHVVIAQHLDVAGEWFGRAGLVCAPGAEANRLQEALNAVCEVLDNYLFSIKAMREKHLVMMRLGNALRHRVLGEGVKQAVEVLADAIPVHKLVLVYRAEEGTGKTLHIQLYEGKELKVDTLSNEDESFSTLQMLGRDYLAGDSPDFLKELGVADAQEEVLINGITKSVVVGKVVVTATHGTFNTYDRELLAAFAGFIRQRIVDFSKEWRSLAYSFRPADVARLLQTEDYERRYLAPREEVVAILYVDIAGFTRLSETKLKTPARVAELVETWSRDAVELVWTHGGVFDKMVGDCIIALFGPPFYDENEGERLARAIECARDVRAMTNLLAERKMFDHLKEEGVHVSTGVNLAPLFVGQFGPNSNFTGFSSGMNNTARLQGCAGKDEILVMADALKKLPDNAGFEFGDERSAPVKNVAEPLRFRTLVK